MTDDYANDNSAAEPVAKCVLVRGIVQGVGYRPFVACLANEYRLQGSVVNTGNAVRILVRGPREPVERFIGLLKQQSRTFVCNHRTIEFEVCPLLIDVRFAGEQEQAPSGFHIAASAASPQAFGCLTPDSAVCATCLAELFDPGNRRYRYPFVGCSQCGPRYAVTKASPFDRKTTTYADFAMCPQCHQEYTDSGDRRFHSQTITCAACGPVLTVCDGEGAAVSAHTPGDPVTFIVEALKDGAVVAVKGFSGFHLLSVVTAEAVARIRKIKARPEKPLALLYPSIERIRQDCDLSPGQEALLRSAAAPIVLLDKKQPGDPVLERVAPRNPRLGVMLAHNAIQYLLLRQMGAPLIATSANLKGEPVCADNDWALVTFRRRVDYFLLHNLAIVQPQDDSIVQEVAGAPMLLRSGRGYAPSVHFLPVPADTRTLSPNTFAAGAFLKNSFTVMGRLRVISSQYLGDLQSSRVRERRDSLLKRAVSPQSRASLLVDAHPDAETVGTALDAERLIPVPHHHAHAAAVMAEWQLTKPHLAAVWDGMGFGEDGTLWGGEFFLYGNRGFQRVACLAPFLLPGGEKAIIENCRVALSLLHQTDSRWIDRYLQRSNALPLSAVDNRLLLQLLEKKYNVMPTSSMGRFMEGVASLLGLRHVNSFEAESAMALQFAAEACRGEFARLNLKWRSEENLWQLDWRETINDIMTLTIGGCPADAIALGIHQALAAAVVQLMRLVNMDTLSLSGGCFQNRLLVELLNQQCSAAGITCVWPQQIPPNDNGISFGQAMYHYYRQRGFPCA